MIDEFGNLKCDNCGCRFGTITKKGLEIVCHRSRCKRYHIFDMSELLKQYNARQNKLPEYDTGDDPTLLGGTSLI